MFNILDITYIPITIYVMVFVLIALILLSIFHSKLKVSTVTKTEYTIEIITALGLLLLFIYPMD